MSNIDLRGLSASDVKAALACIKKLFPNLNVPDTFDFAYLENLITGNEAGGATSAFTGGLTFSNTLYEGPLLDNQIGGLAITVLHEVLHSNQNPWRRFITKWQENLGDDSHNSEALEMVIQSHLDECIKKTRKGDRCE